jgi:hypothetical protein
MLRPTFHGEHKRKRLRHWLCSSHRLLARKPIAWKHAPSQPLDAITAFAVPNPNHSSQSSRFFQVWLPSRFPCRANHPVYFGLTKVYFSQPFRPSTQSTLNSWLTIVNAAL